MRPHQDHNDNIDHQYCDHLIAIIRLLDATISAALAFSIGFIIAYSI